MTEAARFWQAIQRKVGVRPDGVPGSVTARAVAEQLGVVLPDLAAAPVNRWPRDVEAEMRAFYGEPGTGHKSIVPAYPLFYEGRALKTITVHGRIAEAVEEVLSAVLAAYGRKEIARLGLDRFDGCYNVRRKRGGESWSTHAYGAALDFDAARNALHWDHTKAVFAGPEYEAWWRAWEGVGAVSLGREADMDWMHVQFARL